MKSTKRGSGYFHAMGARDLAACRKSQVLSYPKCRWPKWAKDAYLIGFNQY